MKPFHLSVATLIALALVGCGSREEAPPETPLVRTYNPSAFDHHEVDWPAVQDVDELIPETVVLRASDVGPGVAVGEPEPIKHNPELSAFGRGAARWLHLALAANLALDRMPSFRSMSSLLDRGPMLPELNPADAAGIEAAVGTTHALTSRIEGGGGQYVLTLQLHTLPDGAPSGAPLVLAGTLDEITAGLPRLAGQVSQAVGAPAQELPAIRESAADLTLIGGVSRSQHSIAPASNTPALASLASQSDLAALMLMEVARVTADPEIAEEVMGDLPDRAKGNPLIWASGAQASWRLHYRFIVGAVQRWQALRELRPRNYLVNSSGAVMWSCADQYAEAAAAAEAAVQSNPRNPEAWRLLAGAVGNQSDAIRRARVSSDVTHAEWRLLTPLYLRWAAAARSATELDPRGQQNWEDLAHAALFAGRHDVAHDALWRAMEIPPLSLPVDRDRRWVMLMEKASALHKDTRLVLRLPPPSSQ